MPHQTEAVESYAPEAVNPAFFMEMRLGKTLTAIRWVVSKLPSHVTRVLVLAPVTVLTAWKEELWREGERHAVCIGLSQEEREEAVADFWERSDTKRRWLLMNYEGLLFMGDTFKNSRGKLKRCVPDMAYLPWDVVILDESPKIKNPRAQITDVCLRGFKSTLYKSLLTGLPNPEGDLDLICQFLFLDGHFMGYTSYWAARAALFYKCGPAEYFPKPGVRARIKAYVHERAYIMTAAQAGMKPVVVHEKRTVQMNVEQRRMYREVERDFAYTLTDGTHVETKWKLAQQTMLHHLAGGFDPERNLLSSAKADDILHLLETELANKKVVVWFKYRHELEYLRQRLTKAGVGCVSIMGGMPLAERGRRLGLFRGSTRVLLATEQCAKFGIDCSVADTAIYYSNDYSNEARQQSLKRIIHPKKKRTHLIIDMLTENTADEDVVKVVNQKGFESRFFMAKIEAAFRERTHRLYGKARSTQAGASTRRRGSGRSYPAPAAGDGNQGNGSTGIRRQQIPPPHGGLAKIRFKAPRQLG